MHARASSRSHVALSPALQASRRFRAPGRPSLPRPSLRNSVEKRSDSEQVTKEKLTLLLQRQGQPAACTIKPLLHSPALSRTLQAHLFNLAALSDQPMPAAGCGAAAAAAAPAAVAAAGAALQPSCSARPPTGSCEQSGQQPLGRPPSRLKQQQQQWRPGTGACQQPCVNPLVAASAADLLPLLRAASAAPGSTVHALVTPRAQARRTTGCTILGTAAAGEPLARQRSTRPATSAQQGSYADVSSRTPRDRQQQQPQQWRQLGAAQAQAPGMMAPGQLSSPLQGSRRGSSSSRPGSAAAGVPPAYSVTGWQPQQQHQLGSMAGKTPLRGSSSVGQQQQQPSSGAGWGRPSTSSSRQQQQRKDEEAAMGPLLCDYFQPPSAAAPGSVVLQHGAAPSVRVPGLQGSWDAAAGGLVLGGGGDGQPRQLTAERPGSSMASLSADGEEQQQERQEMLVWSAAHEVDGRPVTRNGSRAR